MQNSEDRIKIGILMNFPDDDSWILRFCIPGAVPWKGGKYKGKEVAACAFAGDCELTKNMYTREDAVEIGKNICKKFGWIWEDAYLPNGEEEFIDYGKVR